MNYKKKTSISSLEQNYTNMYHIYTHYLWPSTITLNWEHRKYVTHFCEGRDFT